MQCLGKAPNLITFDFHLHLTKCPCDDWAGVFVVMTIQVTFFVFWSIAKNQHR